MFRRGDERLRAGPWRGNDRIAYLTPVPETVPPGPRLLAECIERLWTMGYREAVTGALGPGERTGFLQAGFDVRERLHLLSHDLRDLAPMPPAAPLRRARKTDRARVLEVDNLAFDEFWRLDGPGLDEALAATPAVRFRVAGTPDVVGYAVAGKAGSRGYLQRLAVDPLTQRGGWGRALTLDALHWLVRRGADDAVVNTQEGNERALALYRSVGFRDEPHPLTVMWRALDGASRQ